MGGRPAAGELAFILRIKNPSPGPSRRERIRQSLREDRADIVELNRLSDRAISDYHMTLLSGNAGMLYNNNLVLGSMVSIIVLFATGCFLTTSTSRNSYHSPRTGLPSVSAQPSVGDRNSALISACGSAGMGVDFVTGNCVPSSGGQVNPYNLYPPFQAPLPKQTPSEMILRCPGGVDFVTGQCI